MTRDEVVAVLGPPDDVSVGTKKYPTPAVYKYGEVQIYFDPWKSGKLQYAKDYTDWHNPVLVVGTGD